MDVKMKSEIRNPKSETNPKSEIRRTADKVTTFDSDFRFSAPRLDPLQQAARP
jgi:hypothetical protein